MQRVKDMIQLDNGTEFLQTDSKHIDGTGNFISLRYFFNERQEKMMVRPPGFGPLTRESGPHSMEVEPASNDVQQNDELGK